MSTLNHDAVMFRKLQREAEERVQEKLQENDKEGAEYFRGIAAGFRCAATLIED